MYLGQLHAKASRRHAGALFGGRTGIGFGDHIVTAAGQHLRMRFIDDPHAVDQYTPSQSNIPKSKRSWV